MAAKHLSARFLRMFDALPVEVQLNLVEEQLASLLNLVPPSKARQVLETASQLQTRYVGIPTLDLKAKQCELEAVLEQLSQDSKASIIKGQSIRTELLEEATESVIGWLSDIWTVVYEYKVNFALAHSCLLFVYDAIRKISKADGGCCCFLKNIPFSVKIKSKGGQMIKSFAIKGVHKIDTVLLWIWRELFVSMLSVGRRRELRMIPEMMQDIEECMEWPALYLMLHGGQKPIPDDDEDDDDDNGCDSDFDGDSGGDHIYDGQSDEGDYSDGSSCKCRLQACHWPESINDERISLREHVEEVLKDVFKVTPSLDLFESLLNICPNRAETSKKLVSILSPIATNSSENFVAALGIYREIGDLLTVLSLINSHSYLLRPQDTVVYQESVVHLAAHPLTYEDGVRLLNKELLDTVRAIRAAVNSFFTQIEEAAPKKVMSEIRKLRRGVVRDDRIESWIEAVVGPSASPQNPLGFVAAMMGIGLDDSDEPDPTSYLDLNKDDPDLEHLREEYRPRLKQRFEGWVVVATMTMNGAATLIGLYPKVLELMPYMAAPDAVDQMIGRMAEKASKHYICDGLDSLSSFCKAQRQALRNHKQAKAKTKASKSQSSCARPE